MSNYFTTAAASDIAAAFRLLPADASNAIATEAHRVRMTGTGLSNVVFGKGHPPQGIPLL